MVVNCSEAGHVRRQSAVNAIQIPRESIAVVAAWCIHLQWIGYIVHTTIHRIVCCCLYGVATPMTASRWRMGPWTCDPTKKQALFRAGNAREQNCRAWEWRSHAFPPALTPGVSLWMWPVCAHTLKLQPVLVIISPYSVLKNSWVNIADVWLLIFILLSSKPCRYSATTNIVESKGCQTHTHTRVSSSTLIRTLFARSRHFYRIVPLSI